MSYRPPVELQRQPTYEELFGVVDTRPEAVAQRENAEARRRQELNFEGRIEHVMNDGVGNPVGGQNTGYEYNTPRSFSEAKSFADEVYIKALKNYQQEYEEGSDTHNEIQDFIDAGPLDFNKRETYKLLTENGSFIKDPNNFLRYAVERQSDVMNDYLKSNDIDLSKKVYGEGETIGGADVYLNTGTGAHIDFNSNMSAQGFDWQTTGGEVGQYNQYQYREPEMQMSDKILSNPLVNLAMSIYGGPQGSALMSAARGGDIGDIIEGAAKGYVGDVVGDVVSGFTADIPVNLIEDTLANVGIDADLFGLDPTTFTEGLSNVQETLLEGGSGKEALLKEFGGEALDAIGIDLPEFELPDTGVIGDIRDLGREIDDTLLQPIKESVETVTAPIEDLSTPLKETIETLGEPVVDTIDDIIDAVDSPIGDILDTAVSSLGSTGGMMAGTKKPTQVEDIFDKELFKFDTEIKSTQEMLSPMMNLRRYG